MNNKWNTIGNKHKTPQTDEVLFCINQIVSHKVISNSLIT